ncbi:FA desaturase domain containing protein [Asbolus verrucosus]|uniref:FA desaturase domain containing protein n=1 Tax=Asbolus verrucosus TaxID=1661398 RepID=A0A482W2S5_ASBVE|nr:FA desaturase domain containing protein [Asbolus verrucosus]
MQVQAIVQSEITQEEVKTSVPTKFKDESSKPQYKWELIWRNIILYIIMHLTALYGLILVFVSAKVLTTVWTWFMLVVGLQGITSGVHRLWTHRSYKAKLPLRILLCIFQTIALQNHIYDWVTDHRVHHKYVDTDADPHNSKRGFFFCHMGWLFVKKHKDVIEKTKTIDLRDIEADPVVMFQKKYYHLVLAPLIGFLFPAWVPWYFWNENFVTSFFVATMFRYALTTNCTFLVNSVAHMYGTRPYDKNIRPTDNVPVTVITGGEGWHNYHHTFPWDYKTGELGNYTTNTSTALIDFMAKIGWAYDLKTVSEDMIMKRVNRTGDGTRKFDNHQVVDDHDHHHEGDNLWGWGDEDMKDEDLSYVKITHRKAE